MRGISDGAEALASGDGQKFMNAVALRTAPPRSSTTKDKPEAPAPAPQPAVDTRSPKQKLLDKFR
jgi:PTH1 family peptidyl-tRNA hydrolase